MRERKAIFNTDPRLGALTSIPDPLPHDRLGDHVDIFEVDHRVLSWTHGFRTASFLAPARERGSFAVMRHQRLTEALAFDGDFAAAGFIEVRPSAKAEE